MKATPRSWWPLAARFAKNLAGNQNSRMCAQLSKALGAGIRLTRTAIRNDLSGENLLNVGVFKWRGRRNRANRASSGSSYFWLGLGSIVLLLPKAGARFSMTDIPGDVLNWMAMVKRRSDDRELPVRLVLSVV